MNRYVFRVLIFVALLGPILIILGVSYDFLFDLGKAEAAGIVIAALAVIAAVISAWNTQRIVEMEEQKRRPYLDLYFDFRSRYNLIQLAIKNFGGSSAHNIEIKWDIPIINSKGKEVTFYSSNTASDIPILLSGEQISVLVDTPFNIFKKDLPLKNSGGTIYYSDSLGRKIKQRFSLSLEKYRKELAHSDETAKTYHELQKLPKILKNLNKTLDDIKKEMGKPSDDSK